GLVRPGPGAADDRAPGRFSASHAGRATRATGAVVARTGIPALLPRHPAGPFPGSPGHAPGYCRGHVARRRAQHDPAAAGRKRVAPWPVAQVRTRQPAHHGAAGRRSVAVAGRRRRPGPAVVRRPRGYWPGQHPRAFAGPVRPCRAPGPATSRRRWHARRTALSVPGVRDMSLPSIRALLVDDEILARLALRQALASHANVDIVGECGNADEAMQAIDALSPDLLFLDIRMPGMDGFRLLHELAPEAAPMVVFATAFGQHALLAFDAAAVDYVLKPIDQARFDQAMARVNERWRGRHAD